MILSVILTIIHVIVCLFLVIVVLLQSGKAADLALFKLDELRFSGHGDPLAALVLCGAHRADRVMVGGKWVVTDGAIPGLDVTDLIRRHSAAARKMHGG